MVRELLCEPCAKPRGVKSTDSPIEVAMACQERTYLTTGVLKQAIQCDICGTLLEPPATAVARTTIGIGFPDAYDFDWANIYIQSRQPLPDQHLLNCYNKIYCQCEAP